VPYRLTAIALEDIRQIHAFSADRWGAVHARAYVDTFYEKLEVLVGRPDRDVSRKKRSHPFHMTPVGSHFIVYETIGDMVVVHAFPHQSQDIERYIAKLTPRFRKAVADIKRRL